MTVKLDLIRRGDNFGESKVYTRVEKIEIVDNNDIVIHYSIANSIKKEIISYSDNWERARIFKLEIIP